MKVQFPKSIQILLIIVLSYLILVYGKPFLVPVVFAGLFSMLLLPVSRKLEGWGWNKGISVLVSILLFVSFFVIIGILMGTQVSDIKKNAGSIEQNISDKLVQVKQFVAERFGVSQQKQEQIIEQQQKTSSNKLTAFITGSIGYLGAALTDTLLVIVYMFLFMYFRQHLQKFVMKLVPKQEEGNARSIMEDGRMVAQKYLTGLAMMIVSLWIMYAIGFSIVGVKNALFFAILCGLLEIVPFVGNLAGTAITLIFSLGQGADMNQVIGILITYGTVQFVQSYLLEPMIVGREVSLHPLFTIIGIVAGEFIWGIPGMILALPVLGVIKIVCDHIESLKPFGFLIGDEKEAGGGGGLIKKLKSLIGKKG
jgi:predicted PurR-regulated permease PerM